MTRITLFAAVAGAALLSPAGVHAQDNRPVAAPTAVVTPVPVAQPQSAGTTVTSVQTPAPATAYYPPVGSLQPPLTAAEVCRSLRGGLSGAEVAQDVRERGFTGPLSDDEAADARAAGAAPEFIAALQAGRFTVSSTYARRYAEQAAKNQRAVEANAWRAEASTRSQVWERESELRRQGQIAAENNRAIAAKEREDKRRFENMKAQADWESRRRQEYNTDDGYYWHNHWYSGRYWSGGSWHYY